jgi:nitrous oxidase accessory protein NosD
VEGGATDTVVSDSWFHDCRVGLFVWGAAAAMVRDNAISEPREHAVVTDVAGLDLDGNDLGGDVWISSPDR